MAPELNSMHYARVGVIIGRKNSSWAFLLVVFYVFLMVLLRVFIVCFLIYFPLLMQISERFHKCHQVLIQAQVQV